MQRRRWTPSVLLRLLAPSVFEASALIAALSDKDEARAQQGPEVATVTQAPGASTETDCSIYCCSFNGVLSTELPNVLILGDQVALSASGYFGVVEALLRGVAMVHPSPGFSVEGVPPVPKGVCGSSVGALACMDHWLGHDAGVTWDAISFNWGLQDVSRVLFGAVSDEDYITRIALMHEKMLAKLRPGGRVIWHSTTPVPPGHQFRLDADVRSRNALADLLFHGGSTESSRPLMHDLYTNIVDACRNQEDRGCYPETCACPQFQEPGMAMFTRDGNILAGTFVARAVMEALLRQHNPVEFAVAARDEGGIFDWHEVQDTEEDLTSTTPFSTTPELP